jgi:pantoate--beta-alanine ligase
VRESDGLAMSSRNSYLGPDDRRSAAALYRALLTAQSRLAAGERRAEGLRQAMAGVLAAESRVVCDYVSVADPHTLKELESVGAAGALFSLAAYVGPARLIDNLVVDAQGLLSHGGL